MKRVQRRLHAFRGQAMVEVLCVVGGLAVLVVVDQASGASLTQYFINQLVLFFHRYSFALSLPN